MSNVTFDGDRLWSSLMDTARIGAAPKGDSKRLTLTDEGRQVLEAILDFDSTLESRPVSARDSNRASKQHATRRLAHGPSTQKSYFLKEVRPCQSIVAR